MSKQFPGVITTDYNDTPMGDLSAADYETIHCHLSAQVADCIARASRGQRDGQENDAASDALANTWQPELTVRQWLAAAGERLDVDTSGCVGA